MSLIYDNNEIVKFFDFKLKNIMFEKIYKYINIFIFILFFL